eukprot:gnl/MRDRNA2_/MRDRNA2_182032_c0_seq1.p1 gnl/MRDRNA2_/MRDRNA2_182032_c0~~gnl/MRDRNA2_/MRDRNA2_182032_c0_seq1.p1  ORF type:complete len:875 (-),score=111.58 gnl/MRDRNA2_/MRDRNA2_182032_c0_seq1:109-2733(-)
MVPGTFWYSHSGTVLSVAPWVGGTKTSSNSSDPDVMVLRASTRSKSAVHSRPEADEAASSRTTTRSQTVVRSKTSSDAEGSDIAASTRSRKASADDASNNPVRVAGIYIEDIVGLEEKTRDCLEIYPNRFELIVKLRDQSEARLCFNTRFMRTQCRFSVINLRNFVYPSLPDLSKDFHREDVLSVPQMPAGEPPALSIEGGAGLGAITEVPGMPQENAPHSIISDSTAGKSKLAISDSQQSKPQVRKSLAFVTEQRQSVDPRDRLRALGVTWQGLSGYLEITVMSAGMLAAGTEESFSISSAAASSAAARQHLPSAFCLVYIPVQPEHRQEMWKTRIVERNANPVWNERRHFTVQYSPEDPPPTEIRIEVWNANDESGTKELIGDTQVAFPLATGTQQYHVDLQTNLNKMTQAVRACTGILSYQIKWKKEDHPSHRADEIIRMPRSLKTVCGTLNVQVIQATGIRRADLVRSDAYVCVSVCTSPGCVSSWKTSVCPSTLNPVWMEQQDFRVNWPSNEISSAATVHLELWDHDMISTHDFLGEASFPLPVEVGEDVFERKLRSNRSKSLVEAKGKIQVRVSFRDQFQDPDFEKGQIKELDDYEKAFCRYYSTAFIDDQRAQRVAPFLVSYYLFESRVLAIHWQRLRNHAALDFKGFAESALKSHRWCSLALAFLCALTVTVVLLDNACIESRVESSNERDRCPASESWSAEAPSSSAVAAMAAGHILDGLLSHLFFFTLHLSVSFRSEQTEESKRSLRSWLQPPIFLYLVMLTLAYVCLAHMLAFISVCNDVVFAQFLWSAICIGLLRFPIMPAFWSGVLTVISFISKSHAVMDWFILLAPSKVFPLGSSASNDAVLGNFQQGHQPESVKSNEQE